MNIHESKIFTALIIASAVLGIILIYFLITILKSQRRQLVLEKSALLVEITTLENERKRIVADLHDELGPLLAVVKFQVSSLATTDSNDLMVIEKSGLQLDKILERIREICNHLMPQVLLRKGLVVAIKEFLRDQEARSAVKITYQMEELKIEENAAVHIYRMVQEIIHNALKHAQATQIEVYLNEANNKLMVVVKDNGRGFEVKDVIKNSRGLGLRNILRRVDILGGLAYLDSKPGEGTVYNIEIPNRLIHASN